MSTVIDGFYVRKTDDINIHNDFIKEISPFIKEKQKEYFFKNLIEDFLESIKLNSSFYTAIKDNRGTLHNYILDGILDNINEDISFFEKYMLITSGAYEHNLNSNLNFSFEVYFYMLNKKTFYTFNLKNIRFKSDLIKNILQKNKDLIKYDYFDNYDKPNNINKYEWNQRKEEYEIIFKKSDKFKECLYSCIIYEDTRNYYRNYLNNVIKYFPEQLTINEILKEKSLPRNLLINELIQEPI